VPEEHSEETWIINFGRRLTFSLELEDIALCQ